MDSLPGHGVARCRQPVDGRHADAVGLRPARRLPSSAALARRVRPSTTRPTWGPWSRSRPRPGPRSGWRPIPAKKPITRGRWQRARLEPRGRARRPRVRGPERRRRDLRLRRRQRPPALEERRALRRSPSCPTCWAWPRGGWSSPATASCSSTSRPASWSIPGPMGARSTGYGRGLLAGDLIYWPTQNEIQVLDQRTALPAEPPIKLWENLSPAGRQPGRRRRLPDRGPVRRDGRLLPEQPVDRALPRRDRAVAQACPELLPTGPGGRGDRPRSARARHVRASLGQGPAGEMIDGVSLDGTARDHRFRLLVRLAGQARHARKWDEATAQLEGAAEVARTDPRPALRPAPAGRRLARRRAASKPPSTSASSCSPTSGFARWRSRPPTAIAPIRADLLIADRLKKIVHDHGRGVYLAYDREGRRAVRARPERARPAGCSMSSAALFRWPWSCPMRSWSWERSSKRPGGPARPPTRTNACSCSPRATIAAPLAFWRLAHVYEAMKLFVAARDTYLDLQARFPSIHLEGVDATRPSPSWWPPSSHAPPMPSLVADRPQPPTAVPMVRRWHLPAPAEPVDPGAQRRGSCPCARCRPDVPGRQDRPPAPRPVDRRRALVVRAGRARRLGRLPRRQADRGDAPPDRRSRPGAGDRAMAVRPVATRQGARPARPVRRSQGRRGGRWARPLGRDP